MPPLTVALNPFIWIIWILDFVLWLLLPIPGLGLLKMIGAVSCHNYIDPRRASTCASLLSASYRDSRVVLVVKTADMNGKTRF